MGYSLFYFFLETQWEPKYPGENDTRVNPEERYGQVVFVKEEDEKKGRYIFQDDYEKYLSMLPMTVEMKPERNERKVDDIEK